LPQATGLFREENTDIMAMSFSMFLDIWRPYVEVKTLIRIALQPMLYPVDWYGKDNPVKGPTPVKWYHKNQ
jgi:hypothetical protein